MRWPLALARHTLRSNSPIPHIFSLCFLAALFLLNGAQAAQGWQPAEGPLLTRWAKDVSPKKVHPEYPRPQMVREKWMNLNGLWDYAIAAKEASQPAQFDGQILVPFPVESALSGVMKRVGETERLWYRRTFKLPRNWRGQKVLLHFGAVDWEATVLVNGTPVGSHKGGYSGFSCDITAALRPSGPQEIVVGVWDPTDAGTQPRGKQVRNPRGIWYTPTSGIWQTVWLEPVAETSIETVKLVPDIDAGNIRLTVQTRGDSGKTFTAVQAIVYEGKEVVIRGKFTPGETFPLLVPEAKLWSPDAPFLYDLTLQLVQEGKIVDEVRSYFGMRKIALGKDKKGFTRLFLNNQPVFQLGPLDQGFWPDGLYTAPTDEALRYDIEVTKQLGFNMARKHVKIEPDRWYYWCDKLGLLVWQDMPSGDKYIRRQDPDIERTPESAGQFEAELKALIDGHGNHPSIVMWVPYNEGWGQWDTARIVDWIKAYDPSRLVNNASGWTDRGVGDVNDIHRYPGPAAPKPEEARAGVLGEFGGLGLPVRGHTWQDEKNWGYRSFTNAPALTAAYVDLLVKLYPLIESEGLSAAVYTQTTDVEIEVNGLMTYDRAVVKMDSTAVATANQRVYQLGPARQAFRPPAVPLVACDPYFSVWSMNDWLSDEPTRHWTGTPHPMTTLVRIDGKSFRVMGGDPMSLPALTQTSVQVLPTRTLYEFQGGGIHLTLTFTTPALPDDLDILSRPVTYLTYEAKSLDGKRHAVSLYFDHAADLVVNQPAQKVVGSRQTVGDLAVLKFGSQDQPVLAKKGDNLRIDWGYLYTAAPQAAVSQSVITSMTARERFAAQGTLPAEMDTRLPRPANEDGPVAAFTFDLGKVGRKPVSRWLLLAYDDLYSIQYFRKNLRPYWRRNGMEAADLLKISAQQYEPLQKRCAAFDAELMADLRRAGGEDYAQICALAYRQALAGNKIAADANGQPLLFPKENFSNGCIGTVDVIYPMGPLPLFFSPSLTKAMLVPILDYAQSERWKFPFAPHDLGTYPKANGQVYGGGERTEENQMPVEETGNMLILLAALAQAEGNADFAARYWPLLEQWADYLQQKGFDPENQLCTDDFAGHLAHNVNLSAKAICGLASFAALCDRRGEKAAATQYRSLAKKFAAQWVQEAQDGDHYRLAFDKPGTWSQKYNLVWDRILGLDLFPAEVLRKEMDHYRKVQNRYGLPLDNRQSYTKLDWILWTATLTGDLNDLQALVSPVYAFLNATPDRVPMTDWYLTEDAKRRGFQARPVVGGVFLQMLYDREVWAKWAGRDRTRAAQWAPLPKPPKLVTVLPTSQEEGLAWRYTMEKPTDPSWFAPQFDAAAWPEGPGGFGTRGTPGAVVRTEWKTSDIWLRREIVLPEGNWLNLHLLLHHDEDVEIYLNGTLAATAGGYTTGYEELPLNAAGRGALRPGKNLIAVHCRQTQGGQYIDLGLVDVVAEKPE